MLWAVAQLPDDAALALGAFAGRSWARLGLPRTRDARINLRIAFPEWSEARRTRGLVRSFENLGRSLVELAWLGRRSPEQVLARVRFEGLEHLDAARAAAPGGGVIVMTAHFGSWELFAAVLTARGYPLTVVHRVRDDAGLDEVIVARRAESGATYLPRGSAALGVVRALRKGSLLALLLDQNVGADEGIFVPFLGRLACTRSGPAQLAMSTGAPIVPMFLHRDAMDPARHVARFYPALDIERSRDDDASLAANVRQMTRAVEAEIRAAPELWTWAHRRWRTQPPGEPRPRYRREPKTY
ncbi:MAG: lysophospholipid acyltransferase family protein [Deltaproteobacteria bacterium]|nr:lysophospholipid acyltransferase family protein [Deltaproteobacteria bacterium]